MGFLILGRFEAFVSFCTGSLLCFFPFLKKRGSLESLWELCSIKERQPHGPVPGRQGLPPQLPCCWDPGTGVPPRELDLSANMGNHYHFTVFVLTCVLFAFIAWLPNAFFCYTKEGEKGWGNNPESLSLAALVVKGVWSACRGRTCLKKCNLTSLFMQTSLKNII